LKTCTRYSDDRLKERKDKSAIVQEYQSAGARKSIVS
jgi:hypothetical protein